VDNTRFVRELIVPDTATEWKDGQIVSATNYHFPFDGAPVHNVMHEDGEPRPTKMRLQMRVVEMLMLLEEITENDPKFCRHFLPKVFVEALMPSSTPAKGVSSMTAFYGDPENPVGPEERNIVRNARRCWDEFIEHRGQIAMSGQWVNSPYTEWRLKMERKEEVAREFEAEKAKKEKENGVPIKKPIPFRGDKRD
jgi:hypothetical protein